MEILLINPINRPEARPQYFPLGLAYIASVLQINKVSVDILDINAYRYSDEQVERSLKKSKHNIYGLTGMITEYKEILSLASKIRQYNPAALITMGGPLATLLPDLILKKSEVNLIVRGEGENTIAELAQFRFSQNKWPDIKGISYIDRGEIKHNPAREPIRDMDTIPFPARELFPYDIYLENMKKNWMFDGSYLATNILTSRGCPYQCIYCDHSVWGHHFRQRSASNIIQELETLKNDFGIEAFITSDDTFNLKKEWVAEFCNKLSESALNLDWMCNCRTNHIDLDMLKALRDAGCVTVGFGIESGSDTILTELKKGTTSDKADKAIGMAKALGFKVLTYLIIGSFSESESTVKETTDLLKRHGQKGGFNYLTPIPGTELYNISTKKGLIPDNVEMLLEKWDKWQDNILANLTDNLSNHQLRGLKYRAEKALDTPSNRLKKETYQYYKQFGIKETLKQIFHYGIKKIANFRIWNYLLPKLSSYEDAIIKTDKVKRILFVKLYGIGNALLATPTLSEIRRHFPNAKITLMAEPRAIEILKYNRDFDETILFTPPNNLMKLGRLLIKIRRIKPDLIISTFLMTNKDVAKLYPLSGAKNVIGHNINGKDSWYTHISQYDIQKHEVLLNLDLIRRMRLTPSISKLNLQLTEKEDNEVDSIIKNYNLNSNNLIGFACGSYADMPQKRWPTENFIELGKLLKKEFNFHIILFGDSGEESIAKKIQEGIGSDTINMVGRLNLLTSAELISRCRLFISNDTGLMHIAAALDTPLVSIFGPTNVLKNRPWTDDYKRIIISSSRFCSPCHEPGDPIRCKNNRCMKEIKIATVFSSAKHLLLTANETNKKDS